jgi:prepilin-type N-terminal cleavage/methylation domain-containing protein
MKRDGFGLIEALVALVLIGLAAGTALGALSSGYSAAARARTEVIMMELAEMKMAEIRSSAPEELRSHIDQGSRLRPFAPPFDALAWSVAVGRESASADLFQVQVTVRSATHERTLRTLMYSRSPQAVVN